MISDRDIWAAALPIVKRYGDDAMLEPARRADQLLNEGNMAAADVAGFTSAFSSSTRPANNPIPSMGDCRHLALFEQF
jgi:hypothetical protein